MDKNILKSARYRHPINPSFWPGNMMLSALILLSVGAARADEIADAYQRLQQSPASVVLNLQYATAAEKGGKLKWALPAYERALMADPRNAEAKEGIDRVTRKIHIEAGSP
jgi:hypothetical protein